MSRAKATLLSVFGGLPDFIIIGAQKAGTSSLHAYLTKHPDILRPTTKELDYFCCRYDRGPRWYRAQFAPTSLSRLKKRIRTQRPVLGEATPHYLVHPLAARRIAMVAPGVKLIVLLRNPVDRALSQYHHNRRLGHEEETLARALELEESRLRGERQKILADVAYYSYAHRFHSYKTRGRYLEQLEEYERHFPREQILILSAERLFRDPQDVFDQVLSFLGASPHRLADTEARNVGSYVRNVGSYAPTDIEALAELEAYFRPYNEALFAHLDDDLSWYNRGTD